MLTTAVPVARLHGVISLTKRSVGSSRVVEAAVVRVLTLLLLKITHPALLTMVLLLSKMKMMHRGITRGSTWSVGVRWTRSGRLWGCRTR